MAANIKEDGVFGVVFAWVAMLLLSAVALAWIAVIFSIPLYIIMVLAGEFIR